MLRVAIAILVSVLISSTAHAKRVALVVGINKHDNLPRGRQLAKAVNDARAMEASAQSGSLRPFHARRDTPRYLRQPLAFS
jgi:hypothetical protein